MSLPFHSRACVGTLKLHKRSENGVNCRRIFAGHLRTYPTKTYRDLVGCRKFVGPVRCPRSEPRSPSFLQASPHFTKSSTITTSLFRSFFSLHSLQSVQAHFIPVENNFTSRILNIMPADTVGKVDSFPRLQFLIADIRPS